MFLKKRTSSVHLRFQTTLPVTIPWSQTLSFNIIFFYLEICDAKRRWKRRAERKESFWSRWLRISLSCCSALDSCQRCHFLLTNHIPNPYPIIWLVEQLKVSSNQRRRSEADGMKVRIPTVLFRGFFSWLSALLANKKKIKEAVRVAKFAKKE